MGYGSDKARDLRQRKAGARSAVSERRPRDGFRPADAGLAKEERGGAEKESLLGKYQSEQEDFRFGGVVPAYQAGCKSCGGAFAQHDQLTTAAAEALLTNSA